VIEHFIEQFTYVGVFVVLLLGSLGVPIPEEIPVLAAAALSHEAIVRWWIALPVCLAGVLSGDMVLYWIGRRWGERVLAWRHVRYFITPERERVLADRYRRHGVKIIVIGRHVMGLRAAAFLTAGIVRLPFGKFVIVDTATATVGVTFGFFVGYAFTEHLMAMVRGVHRIDRWLALASLLAVALCAFLLYRRQQRRLGLSREGAAEQEGSA
jgi:membrane protein DedA with SNARE-associated domain